MDLTIVIPLFILHALSLGLMLAIFFEYRHIERKYRTLIEQIQDIQPGTVFHAFPYALWIYVITTLVLTCVSIFLILVKPHLL